MRTIAHKFYDNEVNLSLVVDKYVNNESLAIILWDEDDDDYYGDFTVNLPDHSDWLFDNEAYVDTNNVSKALIKTLESLEICKPTGIVNQSGYCKYPLYEFDLKRVMEFQHQFV